MTIIIYTNYLYVSYDVKYNGSREELAKALDEGPVYLETMQGSNIFINPINATVIEIKDSPLS